MNHLVVRVAEDLQRLAFRALSQNVRESVYNNDAKRNASRVGSESSRLILVTIFKTSYVSNYNAVRLSMYRLLLPPFFTYNIHDHVPTCKYNYVLHISYT